MYTIVNWPSLQKRVSKVTGEESYEINSSIKFLFHRIQDGQVFEFTKLILFLKMYFGGWSSSIYPNNRILNNNSCPAKRAWKMI